VSTRNATTTIKLTMGRDGRWSDRKEKNDDRSNITVRPISWDFSLMMEPASRGSYTQA
jgi:hypothetical protein